MGEKTKALAKREFSAGGVVYKKSTGLWLITRSSPSSMFPRSIWRLPKGRVDEGESVEEAAVREVAEEAGVKAKIVKRIETIKYFFTIGDKKIFKFVTFYLMEWIEDLPEGFDFETAEIAWMEYNNAVKTLDYSSEKAILKKAFVEVV